MIILNFDTDIRNYAKNFREICRGILNKLIRAIIICPVCNGGLKYNCTYPRKPKTADGTKFNIGIVQVYCESCDKTHAIIPDFLMPYKHYTTNTVETAVSSDIGDIDCTADNSTIYRWHKQFKKRGAKAVVQICLILLDLCQRTVSINKLNDLSVIKQLFLCVAELDAVQSTTVIGSANVVLTRANAGFL
ncbi:MAG: DUF6431 domain-containing protein [Clostridiales bacterium]|jgi:hypothetical protein|nr:DUF6431 domain-containing protein [Clostridiales bacterium]